MAAATATAMGSYLLPSTVQYRGIQFHDHVMMHASMRSGCTVYIMMCIILLDRLSRRVLYYCFGLPRLSSSSYHLGKTLTNEAGVIVTTRGQRATDSKLHVITDSTVPASTA